MTTITEPGLYQDFDESAYHADPCPEPSASRSIIKLIEDKTPRHAFIAHPRLAPDFERKEDDKFSIGTAAHAAILSRGKKVAVGDFPDYKTKAAQEWKAAAKGAGLVPLLAEQANRVSALAAAVTEQLPDFGLGHLFDREHGRAEVVGAWQDPVAGWSRIMFDWLEKDMTATDLKITEVDDLSPEALGRHMSQMGYEFQHAFYERGLVHLYPELAGRFRMRFLFVEAKAPHSIMPVVLPADAIAKGRAKVESGVRKWAAAKAAGEWPRYSGRERIVEYPVWSTAEYAAEAEGE